MNVATHTGFICTGWTWYVLSNSAIRLCSWFTVSFHPGYDCGLLSTHSPFKITYYASSFHRQRVRFHLLSTIIYDVDLFQASIHTTYWIDKPQGKFARLRFPRKMLRHMECSPFPSLSIFWLLLAIFSLQWCCASCYTDLEQGSKGQPESPSQTDANFS